MSDRCDQRMRPAPVKIPPLPPLYPPPIPQPVLPTEQQSSELCFPRSQHSELTWPLGHEGARLSRSQTETSKLSSASHQKEGFESMPARQSTSRPSTVRSKYTGSPRQHVTGYVSFEQTARGQMEARSEQELFKRTGQLPPTPTEGTINEDDVFIRTEDLRAKCRVVSEERRQKDDEAKKKKKERKEKKQKDRDEAQTFFLEEPPKSPKKSLLGNIKSAFTRTTNNPTAPPVESKAAVVFGTAPRIPKKIEARPIKPSGYSPSPTRVPRSDTSKSLPEKIANIGSFARRHHGMSHRSRETHMSQSRRRRLRASSGSSKYSSDAESMPLVPPINTSLEEMPPAPPAKDTPPAQRLAEVPQSPLRRAPPSRRLRETYTGEGEDVDTGRLRLPDFTLSPDPSNTTISGDPTKHQQYTSEDYAKVMTGEPLQWPRRQDSLGQQENRKSASLASETHRAVRARKWSLSSDSGPDSGPTLAPRFYTPARRLPDPAADPFTEADVTSRRPIVNRLLFSDPPRTNPHYVHQKASKGSIDMVFRGLATDIDPHTSTGELISKPREDVITSQDRDDKDTVTHGMQGLQVGNPRESALQETGASSRPLLEHSSSRLTDMLSGVSPRKTEFNADFQPNCLSAIPSPLNQGSRPRAPAQPAMSSPASLVSRPRSLENHFYMTNEHMDVVGKSIYDVIESINHRQSSSLSTQHGQILTQLEKIQSKIRSEANTLNEKADRAAEKHSHIHNDIEAGLAFMEDVKDDVKQEITTAIAAQDEKIKDVNTNLKQLQNTIQGLQQLFEQTLAELRTPGPQHAAPGTVSIPNASVVDSSLSAPRPQPPLAGYHETAGANVLVTRPLFENRGVTPAWDHHHHDQRAGYTMGYGQQYGSRQGYSGRNSGGERPPYNTTNPYNYASGGQFNSSYTGGYSDQAHPYNQGPTS